MKRVKLWTVTEDPDGRVRAESLDEVSSSETERRLEDLLVSSPELLLDGLSLIGRQLPSTAGILDLLGIDRDGRLVLLELKRGTLTREAVAQILDYVSELMATDAEAFARLVQSHSGRNGIERFEDFADWYAREFPDSPGLMRTPRMVLVGLGADERAKRIVNFLADAGIDVQLLTFHAFHSGGRLFLAKQVETVDPGPGPIEGVTKEDRRRALLQLAAQRGVEELLKEVADLIQQSGPFYRWPGKTAYSFSLPEKTEEGRGTSRSYLTLWVHQKRKGALLLTFAPRVLEAVPRDVEAFVQTVPNARRSDSSWTPLEVEIDRSSWLSVMPALSHLMTRLVEQWQTANVQEEAAQEEAAKPAGGLEEIEPAGERVE